MEEWADPRAVEQLQSAFARYDKGDIVSSLLVTMDLYRWLEDETANHWGYSIPLEGERQAGDAARQLLNGIR